MPRPMKEIRVEEKLENLNANVAIKRHNRVSSDIQTRMEGFKTLLGQLHDLQQQSCMGKE